MNEQSPILLVLDDNSEAYPPPEGQQEVAEKHGFCWVFADNENPIKDGLSRLRRDRQRRIAAVLTDSFEGTSPPAGSGTPFWHVRKIRGLRPDLHVFVYSAGLTPRAIAAAKEAGAEECLRKGESLGRVYEKVSNAVSSRRLSPRERFWRDLPNLLERSFGRWVVYTSEGLRREADDPVALYAWCDRKAWSPDRFVVAQVLPDQPVAEVPDDWFDS